MISILESLLPSRYRGDEVPPAAAVICGICQILLSVAALIIRAIVWARNRTQVDLHSAAILGGEDIPGSGIFLLVEFWLNPLHLFIFYIMIEGMVRTLAALVSHQVIGTLPLYLVSGTHGLIDKIRYQRHIGPLVVDQVVRGDTKQAYDLKIYSCRPKLNWNPYMTIEFEDEFYQYLREEQGPPPRRFIFFLRKNPVGRSVVVIDHYKPDDVMKPQPDKWAGAPGLRHKLLPNWNLPPLVPDVIVQGGSKQDYDLKIYNCRRKGDWNTYITIEFEGQWYQLIREDNGTKAHPFVYYLRKAPQTRPAVVIRKYSRSL